MDSTLVEPAKKRRGNPHPANAGKGRPKGVPNLATSNAREAIARFVDGNVERLEGWLQQIADDPKHGPLAAFKCVQEVMEYHIPKLARTELTGAGGGPVVIKASKEDEEL